MSLTKIFRAPIKLFKKEVITFLIIRRYDLGAAEEQVSYLSVKPTASISMLRQKIWHLLELPDYCEEIIVLKFGEKEVPLTELRKGNNPQQPYVMEVWLPETRPLTLHNNMLTMGENELCNQISSSNTKTEDNHGTHTTYHNTNVNATLSNGTTGQNRLRVTENKQVNFLYPDFKKSGLDARISSCSLFRLNKKKSRDSFTNILLKIQSDLSTLSNKLSSLENRIPA